MNRLACDNNMRAAAATASRKGGGVRPTGNATPGIVAYQYGVRTRRQRLNATQIPHAMTATLVTTLKNFDAGAEASGSSSTCRQTAIIMKMMAALDKKPKTVDISPSVQFPRSGIRTLLVPSRPRDPIHAGRSTPRFRPSTSAAAIASNRSRRENRRVPSLRYKAK